MARKPVNQISHIETRDALWAAIRAFGRPFTSRELRVETRCSASQVGEYLKGLTAAGIVDLARNGKHPDNPPGTAHLYRLTRDLGVEAPRVRRDGSEVTQGRGREQMWETMRALGRFSPRDLHVFASTDEHRVSLAEAAHYCRYLAKAGYLEANNGGFTLVRRTGPKPPMIQRTRQVYDPNTGTVTWREEAGHDAD